MDLLVHLVGLVRLDVVKSVTEARFGVEVSGQVWLQRAVGLEKRAGVVGLVLGCFRAELVFEGALGFGHGLAEVLFGGEFGVQGAGLRGVGVVGVVGCGGAF